MSRSLVKDGIKLASQIKTPNQEPKQQQNCVVVLLAAKLHARGTKYAQHSSLMHKHGSLSTVTQHDCLPAAQKEGPLTSV